MTFIFRKDGRLHRQRQNTGFRFLISALLVVSGAGTVCAGGFLHPADNSYSLKNVFSRPYLQSRPVGDVWTAGAETEEFRKQYLDAKAPVSFQERQLAAYFWQQEAESEMNFWEQFRDQEREDINILSDTLAGLEPITEQAADLAAAENALVSEKSEQMLLSRYSPRKLEDELDDWQAYVKTLDKAVRTDLELAALEPSLRIRDRKTTDVILEQLSEKTTEQELKTAQDIYKIETRRMVAMDEMNDVLWSLWLNDMQDMGSNIELLNIEDVYAFEDIDKTGKYAETTSELDTKPETAQIQKDESTSKWDGFFKILNKHYGKKQDNGKNY